MRIKKGSEKPFRVIYAEALEWARRAVREAERRQREGLPWESRPHCGSPWCHICGRLSQRVAL